MSQTNPQLGRDLYQILPEIYRTRDRDNAAEQRFLDRGGSQEEFKKHGGDLQRYLEGCGELLDRVYDTLVQKHADQFPDNPGGGLPGPDFGLACQDWLLPYFADLLDVTLVSPLVEGRRDEISKAIAWRQRKGTLAVIEQIVEAIAQSESVVHEGWKRVAITPRVGKSILPMTFYGYAAEPTANTATLMARHPDLPAATVDFRCPSGAVKTTPDNPAAQTAIVDGKPRRWRQASFHGTPCHAGSHEDASRRTVDFRTPSWKQGHYHPRRILLYTAPSAGFFPDDLETVQWDDRANPGGLFQKLIEIDESNPAITIIRNKSLNSTTFTPVKIEQAIELDQPVTIKGRTWRFEGLVMDDTVSLHKGRLELQNCAVRRVELMTADDGSPVLNARCSLLGALQADAGLCRLEFCTVLNDVVAEVLQASDCIFVNAIRQDLIGPAPPERGCIRFSRVSPDQVFAGIARHQSTTDKAIFFSTVFGEIGAGVLHPATSAAICFGAEDGGEMGAFHDHFHCRIRAAVDEKLSDFVPLGIQAVQIPDSRLREAPLIAETD